ncbi:hypothetical protein IW262DRAFT_1451464 [Armillaria fumosa]|nr:hypothetical protein IW262DRAFT_1451464 [Armillaria fumosa]
MDISNTRSKWDSAKVKGKVVAHECKGMPQKLLRKLLQSVNRKSDQFPEVTISAWTEIEQTEESIKVPKQRMYTGREPIISSCVADTPCSSLGIQGLLDLLNTTLRTSYTLDTPSLSSILTDCIAKNYDFGIAYGRKHEAQDVRWREDALEGSRIVNPSIYPRRLWDLYSNRVVPWWNCREGYVLNDEARPISHAWVDEVDRVDVWTPINGYEWPVPIPKGANLNLIRIEMLNLGLEYTWLDVLCLRQRGGPREDLRVEEWKLDVPTIGGIYNLAEVESDLESDRCWFRRAWTLQEVGSSRIIAGDTPDGPLHAKPIDEEGNYEDEVLTKFHMQIESAKKQMGYGIEKLYGRLSMMHDRVSTYPIDRVAGLTFTLRTTAIPSYYENQSLEGAWTALIEEMFVAYRGLLFFTYPEPGNGCKRWRPSWEQVMEKSLPKDIEGSSRPPYVTRGDYGHDWYKGLCIERGLVRGLAVEGEGQEGINRCGELVVEDTDGIPHSFNILAGHQYPIPEDTYTLLGTATFEPPPQYWVVGRRLPNMMFEKVSVFTMAGIDEKKRLKKLVLAAESRSILA